MPDLELVSHHLCPYVQRAAITLSEKQIPFRRSYIDLAAKPDWFLALSPLGRVPLLRLGAHALFESAAICGYLDDVVAPRMHPADPIARAEHRAWIAFASATLDTIGRLYNAADEATFEARVTDLTGKFERLNDSLGDGPYFTGASFSLVDAAFAPVFRYFDVLDRFVELGVFAGAPKVRSWRLALSRRPSVQAAVTADYADQLEAFLRARNSHLSRSMVAAIPAPQLILA